MSRPRRRGPTCTDDPSDPANPTGNTFALADPAQDQMVAYNDYLATGDSAAGSSNGETAISCRTDAFSGTDIPYAMVDFNVMSGAPSRWCGTPEVRPSGRATRRTALLTATSGPRLAGRTNSTANPSVFCPRAASGRERRASADASARLGAGILTVQQACYAVAHGCVGARPSQQHRASHRCG